MNTSKTKTTGTAQRIPSSSWPGAQRHGSKHQQAKQGDSRKIVIRYAVTYLTRPNFQKKEIYTRKAECQCEHIVHIPDLAYRTLAKNPPVLLYYQATRIVVHVLTLKMKTMTKPASCSSFFHVLHSSSAFITKLAGCWIF